MELDGMRVTVIAVGKLKEKYWREAVAEYVKRLGAYCRLVLIEIPDEGITAGTLAAEEEKIKAVEWGRISRRVKEGTYLVALDVRGEPVSSEQLSKRIDRLTLTGRSDITFIIGGSLGLPQEALERADWCLSFSKLTFPHQLMRVILLEQIYRNFKIARGEPYHK